jgi:hypothetical protein
MFHSLHTLNTSPLATLLHAAAWSAKCSCPACQAPGAALTHFDCLHRVSDADLHQRAIGVHVQSQGCAWLSSISISMTCRDAIVPLAAALPAGRQAATMRSGRGKDSSCTQGRVC